MKKYLIYQIDAFATGKFTGNPASVVTNADGLNEKQMQLIARELNNSETAFIFAPDDNTCDGIIRYFTPTTEVPICGHATIAAMYAKALQEKLSTATCRMKTKIGVLPFAIIADHDTYKIIMTQGKVEFGNYLEETLKNKLLEALGISAANLIQQCPIQIVSTGHSKVILGINSRNLLDQLRPNDTALIALGKMINCNGYFVFTFDSDDPEILTYGRMFAPAIGINEDPVTGNAHGPLGAYLVHHQLVRTNGENYSFKGKQGVALKRPGIVEVFVRLQNNEPVEIKIAGMAVMVFKTEIKL